MNARTSLYCLAAVLSPLVLWPTSAPASPQLNQPPVCVLEPGLIVRQQGDWTVVELDGSASYDPEGEPLRYLWSTSEPGAILTDADTARPLLAIDTSKRSKFNFKVGLGISDGVLGSSCQMTIAVKPDEDCCDGKIGFLRMLYAGSNCAKSSHTQDPRKVECTGDPLMAPEVQITVYDKKEPANIWFDGVVELGDLFDVDAANAGEDHFSSETAAEIRDLQGNLLQEVEFHTSCSQPLRRADQFGALIVASCQPDGNGGRPFCEGGSKPRALRMRYTGADCAASSNKQDPGKATCSGDPMFEPTVRILATDKDGADVWFDGVVNLHDSFLIDAANAGEDKLDSETAVFVHDLNGNLLQEVRFHTSCSQPLERGNQFGGLSLTGFVPQGNNEEEGFCAQDGKPQVLRLIYTGRDCSASRNGQDPGKTSCIGDPGMAELVRIRVHDGDGEIWFDDLVRRNRLFTVDAKENGEKELGNETWIEIYDENGSVLLQEVSFHTSCSQPLEQGDFYGSILLVDADLHD